ncbi:hypothetical protein [Pseudomonas japonica]|uniref:Apea-like HEPN domain-containing protein n=1 Tax=Pseudomonas japonica TaxID=256466 RepID=A0A239I3N0_9PSED|nr:hypothetical protein [Pseudomonas japonica]SNS88225.1 hypothetical protein SAMN05444352_117101 [Pseudomonas japonica]
MPSDKSLVTALQTLWDIPLPGPENLWSSHEFVALKKLLTERYHGGKSIFGLETSIGNALRALGLPCINLHLLNQPKPDMDKVAAALTHEFERTITRRRYLCPLDMADEVPSFRFGNTQIGRFSAAELEVLFDAPRLERCYPGIRLDSQSLSLFNWMVVEEDISVRDESGNRQFSWLDFPFGKDQGEIVPHRGRFPAVVERALFFLLLAPWEEWAEMTEVDWRCFRLPWIYTVDDDLCAFPSSPPLPERLSWEPYFRQVDHDEWEESEHPISLRTWATAEDMQRTLGAKWTQLEAARIQASELFSTPVEHFLVRAFLSEGIDEVMAHLIMIEAAFGAEADHKRRLRRTGDNHDQSATRRVAARLSAAIDDPGAAKDYLDLYDMRCTYVHGRPEDRVISTQQRVLARRLAREAANALVGLAQSLESRETVLLDLLNRGVENLPPKSGACS